MRTVSANTTYQAALYRNGAVANDRDYLNGGCIRVDLSDISDIGNNADSLRLEVQQDSWTTFFMLGYSMDIAFPDFVSYQTTTVNSSTSVTVSGKITNTSPQENTGIYDGNLTIDLDSGLVTDLSRCNVIVNGVPAAAAKQLNLIDRDENGNLIEPHYQVQFYGGSITNFMRGNTIEYAIDCSVNGSGKTRFDNKDTFSGLLRSDGVDTRYWINNACTSSSYALAKYKVALNAGTGIKDVSGGGEYTYGQKVTIDAELLPGYHWKDWTGSYHTTIQKYTFDMPAQNITLTANGEANQYTIHFDPNDGTEVTPIPDMTVRYDEEISLPDATNAYIKYTLDGVNVTQNILNGTIVLDENGVDMMILDEKTGAMMTPDGVTVSADGIMTKTNEDGCTTVTYLDGSVVTVSPEGIRTEISADGSKKVSYPDGNVVRVNPDGTTVSSDDVEPNAVSRVTTAADGADNGTDTGTNATDLPAAQADLADNPNVEPKPDKKAYASVFMGWSLEEEKDTFVPQWKAGEPFKVSDLVALAGMTDTNGATITLYAVWDDCPWIAAENLYYTLTQAQSGFITQDEILSHATAYDREDGSPVAPGVHEDGTSFTIPDYLPTDFTQFEHEGSITENLTVIDSVGNTYRKQITVYVVDTAAVAAEPKGTTRFIDEHYAHQPYENGGLEEDSLWKTDSGYAAALQTAFENLRNQTPMEAYTFSHETILEMKQFIDACGTSDMQSEAVLRQFYHRFCEASRV